jgi:hypothetical protein
MPPTVPPDHPSAESPQAALGRTLRLLVALLLLTALIVMFLHGINLL